MSVSTKVMKIQRARFRNAGAQPRRRKDLKKHPCHTYTHTYIHTQVQWGDYGKEQASTPLCTAGSSEKNEGKMR